MNVFNELTNEIIETAKTRERDLDNEFKSLKGITGEWLDINEIREERLKL